MFQHLSEIEGTSESLVASMGIAMIQTAELWSGGWYMKGAGGRDGRGRVGVSDPGLPPTVQ